jgi:orotate phosphoribosyltransferase
MPELLLVKTLQKLSVLRTTADKPFTLASGKSSLVYVDVRLTALSCEGIWVVAPYLYEQVIKYPEVGLVAGVALGGCPLATGVSMCSSTLSKKPLNAIYVRKEPKEHGTGKLVEGKFHALDEVILLEDVVTSGGSSLKAIKSLESVGLKVKAVVTVLDREEGGRALIEKHCPLHALVTLKELLAE